MYLIKGGAFDYLMVVRGVHSFYKPAPGPTGGEHANNIISISCRWGWLGEAGDSFYSRFFRIIMGKVPAIL